MLEFLYNPWPWYIAGPVIGLMIPALLLLSGRMLGFSSNFRHICAACNFGKVEFFNYEWKSTGRWNLLFLAGTVFGGFLAGYIFENPEPVQLSASTIADLQLLGIHDVSGLVPAEIFSWDSLTSGAGIIILLGGGFLTGFGARYAGGCTSGHAISGLSNLQLVSLIAVIGFFAGGLVMTHIIYPIILG